MSGYLTEKQEGEIKALSANCSCMTELILNKLLSAVEDSIKKAQSEFRQSQENLTIIANLPARIMEQEAKYVAYWEGALSESIIEIETYKLLEKELQTIKLCPG